jgi:leucine-rich repeat protein SHOC2
MNTHQRIKLQKNQSTIPIEKVHEQLQVLEIIAEGIDRLPAGMLARCRSLRSLTLNLPHLSHFPQEVMDLSHLEILKIRCESATLSLPEDGPIGLWKIVHFIGMGLKEFPKWSALLQDLEQLNLAKNTLSDLPAEFIHCRQLRRLTLDTNQFKGLPEVIYKMDNINHLSLDGNPLSDEEKAKIQRELGLWF